MMKLSENAIKVLEKRYLIKDEKRQVSGNAGRAVFQEWPTLSRQPIKLTMKKPM